MSNYRTVNAEETQKNLKALMIDKKVTQRQFCKIAGVARSTMNNWLYGIATPSEGPVEKICKHFGVNKNDVIVYKEEEPKKKKSLQKEPIDYEKWIDKRKKLCESCVYCFHSTHLRCCGYIDIVGERRPCKGTLYSENGKCKCYKKQEGEREHKQATIINKRKLQRESEGIYDAVP